MIALMESAAVKAVARELAPDLTTVGARVEVTHLAPTPMGLRVEARATLLEVEGRQLVFAVSAEDEAGVIGRGTHERVVVQRRGFAEKIEGRRVEAGLRFAGPNERPGG
jgi:predicted thioesterase